MNPLHPPTKFFLFVFLLLCLPPVSSHSQQNTVKEGMYHLASTWDNGIPPGKQSGPMHIYHKVCLGYTDLDVCDKHNDRKKSGPVMNVSGHLIKVFEGGSLDVGTYNERGNGGHFDAFANLLQGAVVQIYTGGKLRVRFGPESEPPFNGWKGNHTHGAVEIHGNVEFWDNANDRLIEFNKLETKSSNNRITWWSTKGSPNDQSRLGFDTVFFNHNTHLDMRGASHGLPGMTNSNPVRLYCGLTRIAKNVVVTTDAVDFTGIVLNGPAHPQWEGLWDIRRPDLYEESKGKFEIQISDSCRFWNAKNPQIRLEGYDSRNIVSLQKIRESQKLNLLKGLTIRLGGYSEIVIPGDADTVLDVGGKFIFEKGLNWFLSEGGGSRVTSITVSPFDPASRDDYDATRIIYRQLATTMVTDTLKLSGSLELLGKGDGDGTLEMTEVTGPGTLTISTRGNFIIRRGAFGGLIHTAPDSAMVTIPAEDTVTVGTLVIDGINYPIGYHRSSGLPGFSGRGVLKIISSTTISESQDPQFLLPSGFLSKQMDFSIFTKIGNFLTGRSQSREN